MITYKNCILYRKINKPILFDMFMSHKAQQQPVIIFCHGYKGFKNWGAWPNMAKRIANNGYCVINFNFSNNGGTIFQPEDFPDLKAFGHNNYSKELNDLESIITWVCCNSSIKPFVDSHHITLLGHSRGGGISLLQTATDKRIKNVITLASVSDFESRFGSKKDLEQWKTEGVKYVENKRTKQQMPHYYQFYEDFLKHKTQLNIQSAVKNIKIPQLIIHGDNDTSVSLNDAKQLKHWNPNAHLKVIKNANHVFNTKHPWASSALPPEFEEAIHHILQFLKQ